MGRITFCNAYLLELTGWRLDQILGRDAFEVFLQRLASLFPHDGTDAPTLFKHAEVALKKAKIGGDRYLFYAQRMTDTVAGRLTLENQLRQALDREEFVLHWR